MTSGFKSALFRNAFSVTLAAATISIAFHSALAAPTITVTSLYDASSFVPGFLLPFKLQGSMIDSGSVTSTSISNDSGADCRLMPDPYLKNIFLIKCDAKANVSVVFNVLSGNVLTPVKYGPIAVKLPANGLTAIGASGGGSGGALTPSAQGQALFTKYGCVNCHAGSMPKGASASDIQNALNSVSVMSFLKGTVTSSDEALIATYLGGI